MEKPTPAIIHAISKEILEIENENKELLHHQKYLQFNALIMVIALNEGKTVLQVKQKLHIRHSLNAVLNYLSWENRDKIFIISNRGEVLNAKTKEEVNTIDSLFKALTNTP